jgi:uncharacterized protein
MALFAIADPHLGFGVDKPMAVFGGCWQDHARRLEENWLQMICSEDTVLIPGDISWAMRLPDALPDLQFLDRLPGRKILSRGNHDYWWTSLAKMEQFCRASQLATLSFLRNNGLPVEPGRIVCGTRGWILPDDPDFRQADERIYQREAGRLLLSLESAAQLRRPGDELIACLHFPPFGKDGGPSLFTELLEQYQVGRCIFGHIHGGNGAGCCVGPSGKVAYSLASADCLGFKPLRL